LGDEVALEAVFEGLEEGLGAAGAVGVRVAPEFVERLGLKALGKPLAPVAA
jgi:hypothetical protein